MSDTETQPVAVMSVRRKRAHSILSFSILFCSMAVAEFGVKYHIEDHLQQIFKLVEDGSHSISGIELEMTPSYFDNLLPFAMTVACSDGTMDVLGMELIDLEQSFMEVINKNESYLQGKFAVSDLTYTYDLCWLNLGFPIPIWLRGKVINSKYFISARITYKPKCNVVIERAELVSYEKLTVNIFRWMPGSFGDWILESIIRNTQDRIFQTVENSIKWNAESLINYYNPCIVFPSMGRMTLLNAKEKTEGSMPDKLLLKEFKMPYWLVEKVCKPGDPQEHEEHLGEDGSENEPKNATEFGQQAAAATAAPALVPKDNLTETNDNKVTERDESRRSKL